MRVEDFVSGLKEDGWSFIVVTTDHRQQVCSPERLALLILSGVRHVENALSINYDSIMRSDQSFYSQGFGAHDGVSWVAGVVCLKDGAWPSSGAPDMADEFENVQHVEAPEPVGDVDNQYLGISPSEIRIPIPAQWSSRIDSPWRMDDGHVNWARFRTAEQVVDPQDAEQPVESEVQSNANVATRVQTNYWDNLSRTGRYRRSPASDENT